MVADEFLTPAQVADIFHVSPKTVTRWADKGALNCERTIGGHRRFRASYIRRVHQLYSKLFDTTEEDDNP